MCDFHGQPHLEEVVWVCTGYQSEQKKGVCNIQNVRWSLCVSKDINRKHLLSTFFCRGYLIV